MQKDVTPVHCAMSSVITCNMLFVVISVVIVVFCMIVSDATTVLRAGISEISHTVFLMKKWRRKTILKEESKYYNNTLIKSFIKNTLRPVRKMPFIRTYGILIIREVYEIF